jgi:DNA-binding IclR family transcriptional regulator
MPSLRLSLATLHEHQQIYWLTVDAGHEPNEMVVGGYPLHLSSVALRLLLDQPREQALAHLAMSRRWNGWERPTPSVPTTATALLADVRRRLVDGVLVLDGWQREGHLSAALPVRAPDGRPLALAISGPSPADRDAALAHLRDSRDAVEAVLIPGATP